MAIKIGPTKEVLIPHELERSTDYYPSFVHFESSNDAVAAQACWDGLVLYGSKLRGVLLDEPTNTNPWKETIVAVESKNGVMGDLVEHNDTTIEITGILTEDDYDDEDCMGETLDDESRKSLATFKSSSQGQQGMDRFMLHSMEKKIGGKTLSVGIVPRRASSSSNAVVVLENLITEDDMEDEDCLEETLGDIRELAERHGTIAALELAGTVVKLTFMVLLPLRRIVPQP